MGEERGWAGEYDPKGEEDRFRFRLGWVHVCMHAGTRRDSQIRWRRLGPRLPTLARLPSPSPHPPSPVVVRHLPSLRSHPANATPWQFTGPRTEPPGVPCEALHGIAPPRPPPLLSLSTSPRGPAPPPHALPLLPTLCAARKCWWCWCEESAAAHDVFAGRVAIVAPEAGALHPHKIAQNRVSSPRPLRHKRTTALSDLQPPAPEVVARRGRGTRVRSEEEQAGVCVCASVCVAL